MWKGPLSASLDSKRRTNPTARARGRGTPAPWDPPRKLVVAGHYRLSRNPMYVGVLSWILGGALLLQSAGLLGYRADLTVFSGNPLAADRTALDARVIWTFVDGELVYPAQSVSAPR
ncbi:MAG: hypothetical protein JNJ88_00145 [Planctomycetes bacterium]|nr:hypothetical protein [Planctomycetota bacterium]